MKKFRKYIKKVDIFGHSINLNFNDKGISHKTIIGGPLPTSVYLIWSFSSMLKAQLNIIMKFKDMEFQL